MKTIDHTKENFQHGSFDLDEVAYIEQTYDSNYVVVLNGNDEHGEEIHIYRSTCVLVPTRNFHSMILEIR